MYDHDADKLHEDITVRLAKQDDLKALSRLYADFYNNLDRLGERWSQEAARRFISHFYNRQPDLFFVAESNNQIVGSIFAAIQPWWDGNHLVEGELLVKRGFQHNPSCSAQLLRALLQTAEARYQAITWDTIAPTTSGHPFQQYQQFGFREVPFWRAVSGDVRTMLAQLRPPRILAPDRRQDSQTGVAVEHKGR